MSQNVTSPKKRATNEINDALPERDIRANSPAVEEVDEGSDDDQQALLSSTSRISRRGEPVFESAGHQQRITDSTHVSNWLYAKCILVEVNDLLTCTFTTKLRTNCFVDYADTAVCTRGYLFDWRVARTTRSK